MKIRKRYKHVDIQNMLKDSKRRLQPYSYMHPQISPLGQTFQEDEDSLAIVSDARRRYINNGWMKRRKVSEQVEISRDTHALMSLEGALTPGVLEALYPSLQFGNPSKKSRGSKLRGEGRQAIATQTEVPVVQPPPSVPPSAGSEEHEMIQAETDVAHQRHGKITAKIKESMGPDIGGIVSDKLPGPINPDPNLGILDPDQREQAREHGQHTLADQSERLEEEVVREHIEEKQSEQEPESGKTPDPPSHAPVPESTPPPQVKKTRNTPKKKMKEAIIKAGGNLKRKSSYSLARLSAYYRTLVPPTDQ